MRNEKVITPREKKKKIKNRTTMRSNRLVIKPIYETKNKKNNVCEKEKN